MTELELYKFIEDSGSETSFDGEKAIILVYHFNVDDFVKLIGDYYLSEGGIEATLQEDYLSVDMTDICKDCNIDIDSVFSQ